jgi:hypothetical protein
LLIAQDEAALDSASAALTRISGALASEFDLVNGSRAEEESPVDALFSELGASRDYGLNALLSEFDIRARRNS